MSFDWMDSPAARPSRTGPARQAMVEKELRQRAAMYYRLRFSRDRAIERLRANVTWDFRSTRPSWLGDDALSAIVDAVYARRG